jgi:predicted acetyltransferase
VVVHIDAHGTADGYAHYDVAWNDDWSGGKGEVHDIVGITDAVELTLWAYLFDIDLVRTWKSDERPLDDVLRAAVADRRAYAIKSVDDEQWVRIVDVEAALAGRTYNDVNGSVTLAVSDAHASANNGTWTVDATGSRRTHEECDLAVDISVLSAVYLGGTAWHTLAAAGAVQVRNEKAITIADNLFASRPLPFSGSFF